MPGADAATKEMNWVIELVQGVRSVRSEMNVPAAAKIPMVLASADPESAGRLERNRDVIMTLARLDSAAAAPAIPKGSAQFVLAEAVVALPLAGIIDFAKERERLEKELKKSADEIGRFAAKLSNEQFTAKAPAEVLAEQREKLAEVSTLKQKLEEALDRLKDF